MANLRLQGHSRGDALPAGPWLSRHRHLILAALLIGGWLLAFRLRFVQDDAFISFRYAKNLVEGHGLVYNAGERTEGYTNFLWTLLMAAGMKLGLGPVNAAIGLGLVLYPFTCLGCWKLFRSTLESVPGSLAAMFVLITNFSFAIYATGGLETQLQILLCVGAALLTIRLTEAPNWPGMIALGTLSSVALLSRMDSAVFLLPCYLTLFWRLRKSFPWGQVLVCVALPAATLAVWMLWRHSYYGEWLPNTFYAKRAGSSHVERGLEYWRMFTGSYFVPAAALACPIVYFFAKPPLLKLSCLISFLWFAYLVQVGGDFMEFRMGVLIYPFLLLVFFWILLKFSLTYTAKIAIPLVLSVLSAYSGLHEKSNPMTLSYYDLQVKGGGVDSWEDVGLSLRRTFGTGSKVVLGMGAAGTVPYYSELKNVDLLALNDAEIAHHARTQGLRPGHEQKASLKQLLEKGVNLVMPRAQLIGPLHKRPELPGSYVMTFLGDDPDLASIEKTGRYVFIPYRPGCYIVGLYLCRSPEIDRLIATQHWPQVPMRLTYYPKQFDKAMAPYHLRLSDFVGQSS